MTLNELLKVVDDNTRIQIRLKMFGSTFSTNRYKNYLLNDEKEAKLLADLRKDDYGGFCTIEGGENDGERT